MLFGVNIIQNMCLSSVKTVVLAGYLKYLPVCVNYRDIISANMQKTKPRECGLIFMVDVKGLEPLTLCV